MWLDLNRRLSLPPLCRDFIYLFFSVFTCEFMLEYQSGADETKLCFFFLDVLYLWGSWKRKQGCMWSLYDLQQTRLQTGVPRHLVGFERCVLMRVCPYYITHYVTESATATPHVYSNHIIHSKSSQHWSSRVLTLWVKSSSLAFSHP